MLSFGTSSQWRNPVCGKTFVLVYLDWQEAKIIAYQSFLFPVQSKSVVHLSSLSLKADNNLNNIIIKVVELLTNCNHRQSWNPPVEWMAHSNHSQCCWVLLYFLQCNSMDCGRHRSSLHVWLPALRKLSLNTPSTLTSPN